jgi:hypothetical protein
MSILCADILSSRYLKEREREVADHKSSVYLLTRERSPGIERRCATTHSTRIARFPWCKSFEIFESFDKATS